MIATVKALDLKVADAVWVATAMLHREQPDKEGFDVAEIVQKVMAEGLTDKEESSVYLHTNQHCVANRPPNQARLRMLFQTKGNLRRLYCGGDAWHPSRNGRFAPEASDMPSSLLPLFDWYGKWCSKRQRNATDRDPLLALAGTGKGLWGRDAVAYVNRLRAE